MRARVHAHTHKCARARARTHKRTRTAVCHGNRTDEKVFENRYVFKADLKELTQVE